MSESVPGGVMRPFLQSCLSIIILFAGLPLAAETLTIAGVEWPPYYYVEDGKRKGFFCELYPELSRRSGIDIRILDIPQKRMLTYFREGRVDAESFTNPEWRGDDSAISAYTVPLMETVDVIFMKKSKALAASSASDFEGKTVGCNLGYYYGEGFAERFASGRIVRDDAVGAEAAVRKLSAGRVDAVILDRLEAAHVFRRLGLSPGDYAVVYTFRHISPLSLRIHKSRSFLLPKLNAAIRSMLEDGYVSRILASYNR